MFPTCPLQGVESQAMSMPYCNLSYQYPQDITMPFGYFMLGHLWGSLGFRVPNMHLGRVVAQLHARRPRTKAFSDLRGSLREEEAGVFWSLAIIQHNPTALSAEVPTVPVSLTGKMRRLNGVVGDHVQATVRRDYEAASGGWDHPSSFKRHPAALPDVVMFVSPQPVRPMIPLNKCNQLKLPAAPPAFRAMKAPIWPEG